MNEFTTETQTNNYAMQKILLLKKHLIPFLPSSFCHLSRSSPHLSSNTQLNATQKTRIKQQVSGVATFSSDTIHGLLNLAAKE